MRKRFGTALLAMGAALILGGASHALAQPANCGDVNGDGQITTGDLSGASGGYDQPRMLGHELRRRATVGQASRAVTRSS
jgi:hypothetical protein